MARRDFTCVKVRRFCACFSFHCFFVISFISFYECVRFLRCSWLDRQQITRCFCYQMMLSEHLVDATGKSRNIPEPGEQDEILSTMWSSFGQLMDNVVTSRSETWENSDDVTETLVSGMSGETKQILYGTSRVRVASHVKRVEQAQIIFYVYCFFAKKRELLKRSLEGFSSNFIFVQTSPLDWISIWFVFFNLVFRSSRKSLAGFYVLFADTARKDARLSCIWMGVWARQGRRTPRDSILCKHSFQLH